MICVGSRRDSISARTIFTIASAATAATTTAAGPSFVRRRSSDGARSLSGRDGCIAGSGGDVHLELTILELRDGDQPLVRGFLNEARELGHAEVLLVECRVDLLHDLLEAIGAHHVAVLLHATDGFL